MDVSNAVPLAALEDIPLVVPDNVRSVDFDDFFAEFCQHASFQPMLHHGRVQSFLAAEGLVMHQRCAALIPGSCDLALPGTRWLPIAPTVTYPWSLIWLKDSESATLHAVRAAVRVLQRRFGWLSGDDDGPAVRHAPPRRSGVTTGASSSTPKDE